MATSSSFNRKYGGTYQLDLVINENETKQTMLIVHDGDELSVSLVAYDDDGNNVKPDTFVDDDKREDLILFFKQAIAMLERR